MNLPNRITLLRILFIPLLVYYILATNLPNNKLIAVVIFVIVALSDYLDGYIARKLKEVTALGQFLDPLADKILVFAALICLVELKIVSSIPVIILIIRDFAVIALRLAASAKGRIIAADTMAKYKTVLLDIAAAALIMNWPYGIQILWLGIFLSVVSGIQYFIKNRKVLNG